MAIKESEKGTRIGPNLMEKIIINNCQVLRDVNKLIKTIWVQRERKQETGLDHQEDS